LTVDWPADGLRAKVKILRPLIPILLFGAAIRYLYQLAYRPWWGGDSGGYSGPFYLWSHHHLTDGARTPMYPLFLGWAQWLTASKPAVVISASSALAATGMQNLFGLVTALLVYLTLRALGVGARFASIAATGFSLIAAVGQFEMIMLPFSLSLFTLMLGACFFVLTLGRIGRGTPNRFFELFTGGIFGVGALVRADNLVVLVILIAVVGLHAVRGYAEPAQRIVARRLLRFCLLAPVGAAPWLLGWMTVNAIGIRQFRLTTIMGYQNTEAVYNLWDRVEAKDKILGEIMFKHFQLTNPPGTTKRDFIWEANPEIQARVAELPVVITHPAMQHIDVGDYLGQVSRNLAERFPKVWLDNALDRFFNGTFIFHFPQTSPGLRSDPASVDGKEVIKRPKLWVWMVKLDQIEAPGLGLCYLLTLGWAVFGPIRLARAGSFNAIEDLAVTALALGTVGTFVAFCLLEGFFTQYSEPHLGVMVICATYTVHRMWVRAPRAPIPAEKC